MQPVCWQQWAYGERGAGAHVHMGNGEVPLDYRMRSVQNQDFFSQHPQEQGQFSSACLMDDCCSPSKAILAINQDPLGKAAAYFRPSGAAAPVNGQLYSYWAGPLSDGVVIGVVAAAGASTLSFKFADVPGLGGSGSYNWTELWTGATGSGTSVTASLGSHDMRVYKVVTKK